MEYSIPCTGTTNGTCHGLLFACTVAAALIRLSRTSRATYSTSTVTVVTEDEICSMAAIVGFHSTSGDEYYQLR